MSTRLQDGVVWIGCNAGYTGAGYHRAGRLLLWYLHLVSCAELPTRRIIAHGAAQVKQNWYLHFVPIEHI